MRNFKRIKETIDKVIFLTLRKKDILINLIMHNLEIIDNFLNNDDFDKLSKLRLDEIQKTFFESLP